MPDPRGIRPGQVGIGTGGVVVGFPPPRPGTPIVPDPDIPPVTGPFAVERFKNLATCLADVRTRVFLPSVEDPCAFTQIAEPGCPCVDVEENPPTIETTCPLTGGQAGEPYDIQLEASGGTAPYTWSIVAGGLPAGLMLSSSGHLTGTPTESGDFSVTFRVADSLGHSATGSSCALAIQTDDEGETCPGITGPAILDFGDIEIFTNGIDVVSPMEVPYDPADYPGMTSVRFRAKVVRSNNVFTAPVSFSIIDDLGAVLATPTLTFALAPTGNYEANVDEAFTPPVTARTLLIKTTQEGGEFQIITPQVWVFMTASDQALFQIPFMLGLAQDGEGGYIRVGNTYARPFAGAMEPGIFKKQGFSQVDYWRFPVIADKSTVAGTWALFNRRTGLMVDGTEIVIATGDGVNKANYSVTIADNATNFTVGDEFEGLMKRTAGAGSLIVISAVGYVKIGSPTVGYFTAPALCAETAESFVRGAVFDCEDAYLDRAYHYLSADWPASTPFYFEVTGNLADTIYMLDTGTAGVPIAPPNNVTSVTFVAGATFTRQRTGPVTLIDDHIYTVGGSQDPVFDIPGFLIGILEGP